jgi:hypothetical protein
MNTNLSKTEKESSESSPEPDGPPIASYGVNLKVPAGLSHERGSETKLSPAKKGIELSNVSAKSKKLDTDVDDDDELDKSGDSEDKEEGGLEKKVFGKEKIDPEEAREIRRQEERNKLEKKLTSA